MTSLPGDVAAGNLLARLRSRTDDMLAAVEELVMIESPSSDPAALKRAADAVDGLGARLLGERAIRTGDHSPVLRWDLPGRGEEPVRVLLLAHLDTVWPLGTTDRWPFSVSEGRATGPGVFDMKAGLVQAMFALSQLPDLAGSDAPLPQTTLLVTSDEEIGSPFGRAVLEAAAASAHAVLVLEPSAAGKLKTARKGVANYRLRIRGRAAHAGLEPERGLNALVVAAKLVLGAEQLANAVVGTTVTPTMASAGTAQNTVPADAEIALDSRAATVAEQQRVDEAVRALARAAGAEVTVHDGINRPPLERGASVMLLARAQEVARALGLPSLDSVAVGGGSDGNFTAALGVPTLDGLGAVGDGPHAEGEYIEVAAMAERAALVAGLLNVLATAPPAALTVYQGEDSR